MLALLLALVWTLGCGGDDGGPDYMDPPDHHMLGPDDCDPRIPELTEGMMASGQQGNIEAELITADKIPLGWYHNDWIIKFTDKASGEPLDDLEFGEVTPWMPAHNHNGDNQFPDIAKVEGAPGEWSFEDINITMAGGWEFQINIDDSAAGPDYVVFEVCNSQPEPDAGE